jgi:hypothetical protein
MDELRERPGSIEMQDGTWQGLEPCLMPSQVATIQASVIVVGRPFDEIFRRLVSPATGSNGFTAKAPRFARAQASLQIIGRCR